LRLTWSQLGLVAALLALAAVGWLVTDQRMAGMDAGPGTDLGTLGFYTGVWVVMMAAMMFPSVWPMALGYRFIAQRRGARGIEPASMALFLLGYLGIWTLFGLVAYGLFDGIRSITSGTFAWHRAGRYLAGGVLLGAAVYQLTPLKDACLHRCRSPVEFFAESWRDGAGGALRMGALHGAWCVGCCWALMAALFALGIMSIGWMVFISALIAAERLLPWRRFANGVVVVLLVVLGLGLIASPTNVPGLTIPGSPAAMHAMSRMHMGHVMGGMPVRRHGPKGAGMPMRHHARMGSAPQRMP
jgi:predicted metal-binding membrane protein